MPIMKPQILKSVNFTKAQKSRSLREQNIFSSHKKIKKQIAHQGLLYGQKGFVAEVTFGRRPQNQKQKLRKNRSPQANTCNLQNLTSLSMRAKIVIPPKQLINLFRQIKKGVGEGGKDTKYSYKVLSFQAVYREVLLVLVE